MEKEKGLMARTAGAFEAAVFQQFRQNTIIHYLRRSSRR